MNILITGNRGLARAIDDACKSHADIVSTCVSRSNGYDINKVRDWYQYFCDFDAVINCAYDGFAQIEVLECFSDIWSGDANKQIINIGSTVSDHVRTEIEINHKYWPYRCHKQSLQIAAQSMMKDRKCIIKLINFGAVDTAMTKHLNVPKLNVNDAARYVLMMILDNNLRRIDLWQ